MANPRDEDDRLAEIIASGPARLRIPDDPEEAKAFLRARIEEAMDDSGDILMTDEEWAKLYEEALKGKRRRAS